MLSRTQAILWVDDLIFAFWLAGPSPTPILLVEVDGEGRILCVLSMALIGADMQAWGRPCGIFCRDVPIVHHVFSLDDSRDVSVCLMTSTYLIGIGMFWSSGMKSFVRCRR